MVLSNFDSVEIKKQKSNVKELSAKKKAMIEELRKITEEEEAKRQQIHSTNPESFQKINHELFEIEEKKRKQQLKL